MIIDPKTIDYSKYKRFFTFGCSFTRYRWPTWSNILHQELHNVKKYYNIGLIASGNQLISNRITEIDLKYKFNETDLVMVMWSTFCREDRWVKERGWINTGSVWTQKEYDNEFIEKYSDATGYVIRDMSLITLSNNYLSNSKCDAIPMLSVPINHDFGRSIKNTIFEPTYRVAKNLYQPIVDSMPKSLQSVEFNNKWEVEHTYYNNYRGDPTVLQDDYHPGPIRYYQYLSKIGFNLSESTLKYAEKYNKILRSSTQDPADRPEMNHSQSYEWVTVF